MSKTKVTHKQDEFCKRILEGHNLTTAYRMTYDAENMSMACVNREAYALSVNVKIAARLVELKDAKDVREYAADLSDREASLSVIRSLMKSATSESVKLNAAVWLGKTVALFTDPVDEDKKRRTVKEIQAEIDLLLAEDAQEKETGENEAGDAAADVSKARIH